MSEPTLARIEQEDYDALLDRVSRLEKAFGLMYDLHNCDSVSSSDGPVRVCPICQAYKEGLQKQ